MSVPFVYGGRYNVRGRVFLVNSLRGLSHFAPAPRKRTTRKSRFLQVHDDDDEGKKENLVM